MIKANGGVSFEVDKTEFVYENEPIKTKNAKNKRKKVQSNILNTNE